MLSLTCLWHNHFSSPKIPTAFTAGTEMCLSEFSTHTEYKIYFITSSGPSFQFFWHMLWQYSWQIIGQSTHAALNFTYLFLWRSYLLIDGVDFVFLFVNWILGVVAFSFCLFQCLITYCSYKSSNKKIATVSSSGYVKGIKTGKCKITVTSKKNKKKKAKITVTGVKKVTSVAIEKPKNQL